MNRGAVVGVGVQIIDKSRVGDRLVTGGTIEIELGCGPLKRHREAVGVDVLDYPGVDIVGDVFDVLKYFPTGSISTVYSYHFLEHIQDLHKLLQELARVLRPSGILNVEVPHFANPYYYSDPTHVRTFGLYTFSYLAQSDIFRRAVPSYGGKHDFVLEDAKLQFDSPFLIRKMLRRAIGPIFNVTRWMQEFHEENLCYFFPAYQIQFRLRRR